ncbi:uncharacterized protein LOC111700989 [Eurytemora carolleeae]|uniref:uncharacterized protein LOC111700989 n=1 Tax=Eurytemora carolleeae TaxID=1294199 RepID=UPI000C7672F6|nr:uncharacterized protein LOC111700989 [Eurytemora carolleeae]|eukprot:XP_023327860.1 uncharacterized protein LOC111700989 [Eurytemora affinis]
MRFILLLCFVGLALARPQEDDVAASTEASDPTTTEAAVAEAAVKDAESDADSTTTTAPERVGSESGSEQINLADTSEFNDLLDVVESGLDTDAQGRALFVTVSMISTSTIPAVPLEVILCY